MRLKVGITGQNGFVGKYLFNSISLLKEDFIPVIFKKEYFDNESELDSFVKECDVIVHLAALNRHVSNEVIYQTNVALVEKLILSLKNTESRAHILFSSSSQEDMENVYGNSKREGRNLLLNWARQSGGTLTGMIIPNVFGPFGKPRYNSFIATFCHQLTHQEEPRIDVDSQVSLIYVGELVATIIDHIKNRTDAPELRVEATTNIKVSAVLATLHDFKERYFNNGEVPELKSLFELNLFNTFRSYINHKERYPVKFEQHTDNRGAFVEIIRLGIGGQVSFSTTKPGITRGNHFHTRKIERFAVIKGKALIQLRKIDTDEVLDFYLDGDEPSYVDMPIWYTHNIKNTGEEELYTMFWINEPYNPQDADTYFVEV